ncbi:MAG: O-antigen ligase family protein [Bacilli bacterium]|nr:O-antigen ligase family protein [Bacilli bacterium]
MKKKFDFIIYLFILLNPFIDCITGLQERFNIPFSIGVIARGIILLSALIYLFLNNKNRKTIYLFLIYLIFECIYTFIYLRTGVFTEFKNLIVIFYLPLMILFFSNYKNKKIDESLITTISFIYLFLIIIPFLFGQGFNTYSGADGKSAFLGFFYEGNELSALMILLLPISIKYLLENRKYIHLIIYLILYMISIILVGTKVLLLGTFVTFLYFGIKYISKFEKRKKLILSFILLMLIGLCILIIPFTPVYKNLIISMDYYGVKNIFDLFKPKFIDNIVFSNRISFAMKVFKTFSSSIIYVLFGIGKFTLILIKDVEIDIFDIVYSIGLIGTIIYIITFNKNIFKLKGIYKFIFILLFVISLFSGHVLIKPMVTTFIALLFMLNEELET